jgi:hypothetical protein
VVLIVVAVTLLVFTAAPFKTEEEEEVEDVPFTVAMIGFGEETVIFW